VNFHNRKANASRDTKYTIAKKNQKKTKKGADKSLKLNNNKG